MFTFGSHGTADGQLLAPHSVCVNKKGLVYVSDESHRVQIFTSEGNGFKPSFLGLPDLDPSVLLFGLQLLQTAPFTSLAMTRRWCINPMGSSSEKSNSLNIPSNPEELLSVLMASMITSLISNRRALLYSPEMASFLITLGSLENFNIPLEFLWVLRETFMSQIPATT